jgi:integrase
MSCQSVLSTKGITIRTTAVNVDPLIGNQVIQEEYRGLDSLPLRQLFQLPGKEIARALVSSQLYSDQNIDPFKLSRIDARLYLAFLMKYDNKATLMRKRDAVREFYRFLKNEYQVNRNEFEFFDRMKVTQDLPKFLSQEEAARLLDTIEPRWNQLD